jgi:uncharacterized protein (DUF2141 family)
MKGLHYSLTLLLISVFTLSTVIVSQDKQTAGQKHIQKKSGKMIVHITGFDSNKGDARVALCNSPENYQGTIPFRHAIERITKNKVEFTFEKVPFGEYAVKCFHDENSNGILDSNSMGVPVEAYGFSNNVPANFGPPAYDAAKFIFNKDKQIIEIKLQ